MGGRPSEGSSDSAGLSSAGQFVGLFVVCRSEPPGWGNPFVLIELSTVAGTALPVNSRTQCPDNPECRAWSDLVTVATAQASFPHPP